MLCGPVFSIINDNGVCTGQFQIFETLKEVITRRQNIKSFNNRIKTYLNFCGYRNSF